MQRDAEIDGTPSAAANGDGIDEDGATFGTITAGQIGASVTVNVQNAPVGAKLDAWIDFNGDGTWNGVGEQIADNVTVNNGDNTITFNAPSDTISGQTYARFRLSTAGNLTTTGLAADGEVEDYLITLSPPGGFGTFIDSGQLLGNAAASAVEVGDLDGDGDLDAFVVNRNGEPDRVWINNNGIFNGGQSLSITNNNGSTDVDLADLDGDGDLDAFVTVSNGMPIVWLNIGDGTFTNTGQVFNHPFTYAVDLADLDGDGDIDAYVGGRGDGIYLNDGNGIFSNNQRTSTSTFSDITLGDLDGDGDLDAFAMINGPTPQVRFNDGNGIFTVSNQDTNIYSAHAALGDLNGDGSLDIFIATGSEEPDRVFFNDGNGFFVDSGQMLGNSGNTGVDLGDLDGDGDLDAFVSGSTVLLSQVWLNDGTGMFSNDGQSLGNGLRAKDIALGDFDDDGDLDAFLAILQQVGLPNRFTPDIVWLNELTNQPPIANNDAGVGFTTDEDTSFTTANVLSNDTDPNAGDILSVQSIDTTLTLGLVVDNGNGTFNYDPNGQFESLVAGSSTTDTFSYTVTDGNDTDTATVTITINGVNDAPVITITNSPTTLFGVGNDDILYQIDPIDGSSQAVGSLGINVGGDPGLAYNPSTDELYLVDGGGTPGLYSVDPDTGAATLVGSPDPAVGGRDPGPAFDPFSNTLYMSVQGTLDPLVPEFFAIDTLTGAATFIGQHSPTAPISGNTNIGLAFNTSNQQLYAVYGNANGSNTVLFTVDPNTAVLTEVGNTGVPRLYGLSYDPVTDTLFAGDQGSSLLYSLDPDTGASNFISNTSISNLEGLATRYSLTAGTLSANEQTETVIIPTGFGIIDPDNTNIETATIQMALVP